MTNIFRIFLKYYLLWFQVFNIILNTKNDGDDRDNISTVALNIRDSVWNYVKKINKNKLKQSQKSLF